MSRYDIFLFVGRTAGFHSFVIRICLKLLKTEMSGGLVEGMQRGIASNPQTATGPYNNISVAVASI